MVLHNPCPEHCGVLLRSESSVPSTPDPESWMFVDSTASGTIVKVVAQVAETREMNDLLHNKIE